MHTTGQRELKGGERERKWLLVSACLGKAKSRRKDRSEFGRVVRMISAA